MEIVLNKTLPLPLEAAQRQSVLLAHAAKAGQAQSVLLAHAARGRKLQSDVWLQRVTFPSGSKIQLTAPSARGKTTLISMLYGIRHDYRGEIQLGGRRSDALKPAQWAHIRQQELAIVFQNLRLFNHFTGLENILIKANLTGPGREVEIREKADFLGIAAALEKRVEILSWGERQRVAIIRALMQPFSWLLLDEPFSHLDQANSQKVIELVRQECQIRGAGLIITCLDDNELFSYDLKVRV